MKVEIKKSTAKGIVAAPPSKSYAHRALICSGLAEGSSIIRGLAPSEDVLASIDCLNALGAEIELKGDTAYVKGVDLTKMEKGGSLICRESGSTLRFMIPLCMMNGNPYSLYGSERLLERPNTIYENICKEKGLNYSLDGDHISVSGNMPAGTYTLPGDVSSQFISGLLFVLPLLDGDSQIVITKKVESRPYIEITMDVLKHFGIEVSWLEDNVIAVPGNQKYIAQDYRVEGDYSNAAFLQAFADFGDVTIENLNPQSFQGDSKYISFFKALKEGYATLNLADTPDLAPITIAYAAVNHGCKLLGTKRLKIKESDRGTVMAEELAKFGVKVMVYDDMIEVGCGIKPPAVALNSHNDHRIAMSCAFLASFTGGIIDDAMAVRKSYPNFYEEIGNLGIEVKYID